MAVAAKPAIEGWFSQEPDPHLIGLACADCNTTVFPPAATTCPNPACASDRLDTRALARTGRIWSWSTNHYQPPQPYVSPDPFVPYTVVAVELDDEQLVVLGQLADGTDPAELHVDMPVEVCVEPLFADEDGTRTVWRFRPRQEAQA